MAEKWLGILRGVGIFRFIAGVLMSSLWTKVENEISDTDKIAIYCITSTHAITNAANAYWASM